MFLVVYPGSFDPVTNGHVDIVKRAANLFERVLVGIYAEPRKRVLFTTEERLDLMKEAVHGLPNVEVTTYTGLTVDFAREHHANALVRGLRSGSDFDTEFEMALMNERLAPEVDSVFLAASLPHQFLSSSLLKEVAQLGGDIDSMVPKHTAAALRERFNTTQT